MEFVIDNVIVTSTLENFTEEEARHYIKYVNEHKTCDDPVVSIDLKLCDDGKIALNYTLQGRKFERIRRITGYLTGDLATWNNAKRAEEKDRIKHDFRGFNYEQ